MIEKDELREQALLHIDRLRPDAEDAEAAVELFFAHVPLKAGRVIGLYWPIQKEFDVRFLLHELVNRGYGVALPVTSRESRVMQYASWDGRDSLVKGNFGTFVPPGSDIVEPDVVIVPMLAFDRRGTRLGRGGGHYDATLAALRQKRDILAIGMAHAGQAVLFNLPVEDHDQKLDMIVTPKDVFDFRN